MKEKMLFSYLLGGSFLILLGIDAVTDLRRRVLYNWVQGGILGIALLMHGLGGGNLLVCALGAIVMSLPLVLLKLIRPGSFGGGDIKMAFAGGAVLGPLKSLTAFAVAFLAAGACLLLLLGLKRYPHKKGFPFGPFLALGLGIGYLFG